MDWLFVLDQIKIELWVIWIIKIDNVLNKNIYSFLNVAHHLMGGNVQSLQWQLHWATHENDEILLS